ncbi:phosphoglycerate dehydrogenase [Candidatus Sumerlaeota bacterium]|nr:phosphoglycerate dehydrogenase [Candidatus Sumerlaeota bacterium]
MARILIADSLSAEGVKILQAGGAFEVDNRPDITPEQLLEDIAQYDAVVIRSRSKIPKEVLQKGSKLKVVGRAGAGLDNVDLAAATELGVVVMNTPGGNTISAAEHAFGLMLSLARNIPQADASMKAGRWEKKKLTGTEVNGKTLGIVGLGRIGIEFAKRAEGFNMRILGFDPFVSADIAKSYNIELCELDKVMCESDLITIHSPKNKDTIGMFNAGVFKKMKKNALLINCARGGIVVEQDLIDALEAGEIAGAALDVFEAEPLPEDSPLRKSGKLVLTPHLAASTEEAQEGVAVQVAEQIVDLLKTGQIRNAANAPDIAPDILGKVRPYLQLGEQLGRFTSQMTPWPVVKLSVRYFGEVLDLPVAPITTAIAKGFVEPKVDPPVNYVNAMKLAERMGIEITDTRDHEKLDYQNLLQLEVESESGEKTLVAGTFFTRTTPRIVQINDKRVVAEPSGTMIVLENKNVPGVIGAVTTLLGEQKINIGELTWGRREDQNEAMTLINVDSEVSSGIIEQIEKLPNINWAKLLTV